MELHTGMLCNASCVASSDFTAQQFATFGHNLHDNDSCVVWDFTITILKFRSNFGVISNSFVFDCCHLYNLCVICVICVHRSHLPMSYQWRESLLVVHQNVPIECPNCPWYDRVTRKHHVPCPMSLIRLCHQKASCHHVTMSQVPRPMSPVPDKVVSPESTMSPKSVMVSADKIGSPETRCH